MKPIAKYTRMSVYVLFVFLCVACSGNKKYEKPDNLLSEKQMVGILVDVHLAEAALGQRNHNPKDIVPETVTTYDSIFAKHKVDPELFRQSYDYYVFQDDKIDKIYAKVIKELTLQNP